jgi:hypothetical protein
MNTTASAPVAATSILDHHFTLQQQLNTFQQISIVLSRSLDLEDTLSAMLKTLKDIAHMQYGLVSLFERCERRSIPHW